MIIDHCEMLIIRLDYWDANSVEVVTACCKDIMVIVNKYAGEIKTFMVGMERNPSTMEWPDSVATVTEQQLWLKEKLTNIETILIKLLEGKLCIFCEQFKTGVIFKCINCRRC